LKQRKKKNPDTDQKPFNPYLPAKNLIRINGLFLSLFCFRLDSYS